MNRSTVWIDHQKAVILDYMTDGIHDREAHADHHVPTPEHNKKFYHKVAAMLTQTNCLYLLGPGMAKEEFKNYLETHNPQLAKSIAETRSMDHASKEEIVQASNHFYRTFHEWVEA